MVVETGVEWWEYCPQMRSYTHAKVVCRLYHSEHGMPRHVIETLQSANVLSSTVASSLCLMKDRPNWINSLKELKIVSTKTAQPSGYFALTRQLQASSSRSYSLSDLLRDQLELLGVKRRRICESDPAKRVKRQRCGILPVKRSPTFLHRRGAPPFLIPAENQMTPANMDDGIREFYNFVCERESIRIRREKGQPRPWSNDPVLQTLRVTNVKRENDRTTKLVRTLLDAKNEDWHSADSLREKKAIAQQWIFNIAVWRRFGSWDFINTMGLREVPSTEHELQEFIEELSGLAVELWKTGICACSDAYFPTKRCYAYEHSLWFYKGVPASLCQALIVPNERRLITNLKAARRKPVSQRCVEDWRVQLVSEAGAEKAKHGYITLMTHGNPIKGIWRNLHNICDSLRIGQDRQSWRQVVEAFQSVKGYRGTGFLAKELTQDLLMTPAMTNVIDINTWSVVGPGARRGINRLRCVHPTFNAGEADFLRALKQVFEKRREHWPPELEGQKTHELVLHDIQFQLCEYDKYMREKNEELGQRRAAFAPFEPRNGYDLSCQTTEGSILC
eukprot:gnl/MRDRNA2_/MRDRNA2_206926_c0_seq1.p1 gnl/MRDRNA2_/MRDRNA2_206926_c0~~gnl/MRDRNA2_/MRDRNA2_206926_c0_seq1.p1  ORF type:complete len:616 (+),score=86.03 gnl/MRDRNA2_/MRDRNA2_206926_c0_seq1:168-1850(+)